MYIKDILKNQPMTVSFEIFPPKKDTMFDSVIKAVDELTKLNPSFVSVTYGAGGGTSQNTVKIASEIQNNRNTTALAHLTCASSTKAYVANVIDELCRQNIKNVLALRGDKPIQYTDYKYAYELITQLKSAHDFCIGGACYPEGHVESSSIDDDIDYLKLKVDAGCDFLITQLFFDNDFLYNYVDKMTKKNISVPVIAGLMPVQSAGQIKRMCELSGAAIPEKLGRLVEKYSDNDSDMLKAGIDYVTLQILNLQEGGFKHYHIYTMNKPFVAKSIVDAVRR